MKITPHLILVLGIPLLSRALVAPDGSLALTDPMGTQGLDWSHVLPFVVSGPSSTSSMIAIDPFHLITAAHVADDTGHISFSVGGSNYNQVAEFYHPTADLAIIRVDAALSGFYEIYQGGYAVPKPEVLMVGYGGVGSIVDSTNFTVGSTGRGTRRWATNKIDALGSYTGGLGNMNQGMQLFFDDTDSTNEGGAGAGDSGGAVFYKDGMDWKLAGLMTDAPTGGGTDSVLALDLQVYESWIQTVIVPEPAPWMMVAGTFGLVLLGGRLRRR